MIDGVRNGGAGRIELNRSAGSSAARAPGQTEQARASSPGSAVADLVALGAPVDADRVQAIRAAIAEGRYPVDPMKIAERMIALDLPDRA